MKNLRAKFLFSVLLSILGPCAFADSTLVAVTDTNILNGISPLNWVRKSDFIGSAVGNASLKVGFAGTSRVMLEIDTKIIGTTVAARYPVISWSVNGGTYQTHQLVKGETSVLLTSGVPDPVIELYLKGFNPFDDRFHGDTPTNSVKITGLVIDKGGITKSVSFPTKLWINMGSSLESGDAALYAANQGRPPDNDWSMSDDARASYPYLLATHFGYREIRIAYGGTNWQGGGAGIPSVATLVDNNTSTVSRLTDGLMIPRPDIVTVYHSGNGTPTANDVINGLTKIRLRTGAATRIIVMISPNLTNRTLIMDAFNSYKNNSQDSNIYLVDVGLITYASADGSHATMAGHQTIYNKVLPAFEKIIPQSTAIGSVQKSKVVHRKADIVTHADRGGSTLDEVDLKGSAKGDGAVRVRIIPAGSAVKSGETDGRFEKRDIFVR